MRERAEKENPRLLMRRKTYPQFGDRRRTVLPDLVAEDDEPHEVQVALDGVGLEVEGEGGRFVDPARSPHPTFLLRMCSRVAAACFAGRQRPTHRRAEQTLGQGEHVAPLERVLPRRRRKFGRQAARFAERGDRLERALEDVGACARERGRGRGQEMGERKGGRRATSLSLLSSYLDENLVDPGRPPHDHALRHARVVEIVALQDDVGRAVGRLEHDGRRAVVRRKGPPRRLKHFVLDLGRDDDFATLFGRVAGGQADDVGGVEVGGVEDGAHFVAGGLWVGWAGVGPPSYAFLGMQSPRGWVGAAAPAPKNPHSLSLTG